MTKRLIWILMILLIVFTAGFANENYYWYQKSDDENSVAVEVYDDGNGGGGGAGGNPWTPGGSWNPGGNWVLFAIKNGMLITNSATIKGRNGWSVGLNSSSENKLIFSAYPDFYSKDFWLGKDADPENAHEVIDFINYVSWEWELEPRKTFYKRYKNEDGMKFNHLDYTVRFNDPSENFPLEAVHFNPTVLNTLEEEDKLKTNNKNKAVVTESKRYSSVEIKNNDLTLKVGTNDLVLEIDSLEFEGDLNIVVEPTVDIGNAGDVFLFLDSCSEINGSRTIGNDAFKEKTHIFYRGSDDFIISGSGLVYASLYLQNAGLQTKASGGGLHEVVSISSGDISLNSKPEEQNQGTEGTEGTDRLCDSIYSLKSKVLVDSDGIINKGIVTGGSLVDVGCAGGGNLSSFTLEYIYAPKAHVRFNYDSTFEGSYIGDSITINSGSIEIKGPPHDVIEKPIIPQPNASNGSGGDGEGDWLITLNLSPDGELSNGVFAIPPGNQSGLTEFDDEDEDGNFLADGGFDIKFRDNAYGDLVLEILWGNSNLYWTMDDLLEGGFFLGNNTNNRIRALQIFPGDYEGTVSIQNNSSSKLNLKVEGVPPYKGTNGGTIKKKGVDLTF